MKNAGIRYLSALLPLMVMMIISISHQAYGQISTAPRYKFDNKTDCNLGTVTLHFPNQADVYINVTGPGIFESTETWGENYNAITVTGTRYNLSAFPSAHTYCGETHTLYMTIGFYHNGVWYPLATRNTAS